MEIKATADEFAGHSVFCTACSAFSGFVRFLIRDPSCLVVNSSTAWLKGNNRPGLCAEARLPPLRGLHFRDLEHSALRDPRVFLEARAGGGSLWNYLPRESEAVGRLSSLHWQCGDNPLVSSLVAPLSSYLLVTPHLKERTAERVYMPWVANLSVPLQGCVCFWPSNLG